MTPILEFIDRTGLNFKFYDAPHPEGDNVVKHGKAWTVLVTGRKGERFITPYSAGILACNLKPITADEREVVKRLQGFNRRFVDADIDVLTYLAARAKPKAEDVLEALTRDAQDSESDFEDWCADLGMEPTVDNRTMHDKCRATRKFLVKACGYEEYQRLIEIVGEM